MKPENKLVAVAVAISLSLTVGYNLLLPAKVKEVVREVVTFGSAGNEYDAIIVRDGASLSGAVLAGDGKPFDRGTTTPCALQTPTNATTSLISLFVDVFRNATDTTRVMYIATSTVPYATTSVFGTRDVAANEKFSFTASTTQSIEGTFDGSGIQFSPGTYVNVNFKGGNHIAGVGTTTELNGSCSLLLNQGGR